MVKYARHRRVRLAHRYRGLPDLREPCRQSLCDFQRQRLDQETAMPGDDLLDDREGDAIVDGVLDGIFLQRTAGFDGQFGIDIKALAERLLFVQHTMPGKEGAVLHTDDVHGQCLKESAISRASIASTTASASTLIATSWTRKRSAPFSRRMTLVAAVPTARWA